MSFGQLACHLEINKIICELKLLTVLASGERIGVREAWKGTYTFQKYIFWMIFIWLFRHYLCKNLRGKIRNHLREQCLLTCHT